MSGMRLIVVNIGTLVCDRRGRMRLAGWEMSQLDIIENAYLLVEDGTVAVFGKMDELPGDGVGADETVDAYRVCRQP